MTIDQWLDEYGQSHKNATNKTIHYIFVPLIMFSVLGILWAIPTPAAFDELVPYHILNWGTIAMAFALIFYLRLSIPLFIGFVFILAAMIAGNAAIWEAINHNALLHVGIMAGVFVVSWVFQFVGHNIEGKKPSFTKDLQFFLIGPAWILAFIYKSLGIPYKLS